MTGKENTELTSAEIANLWMAYINNTLSICLLKHFLAVVEDIEIKSEIEFAHQLAKNYVSAITKIFNKENIPLPDGFSDKDVKPNAPRLFTDIVLINFIKSLSKVGMGTYSLAFTLSSRNDTRALFKYCIESTLELDERVTTVLKNKGLYIRPPYIPLPEQVRYVKKTSFLAGFLTSEKRPLTALEITHLFANFDSNVLGETFMMGFAQVAESKQVRELIWRGKEMAEKHKILFSEKLIEDNVPSPSPWDSGVTTSTIAPFSDKLILFLTTFLMASGIGNYGMAMAGSPRTDIALMYERLKIEIGLFAADGAKLLIENGWFEEPPQSVNRKQLSKLE